MISVDEASQKKARMIQEMHFRNLSQKVRSKFQNKSNRWIKCWYKSSKFDKLLDSIGFTHKPYWRGSSSIGINKATHHLGRVSDQTIILSTHATNERSEFSFIPIHSTWIESKRSACDFFDNNFFFVEYFLTILAVFNNRKIKPPDSNKSSWWIVSFCVLERNELFLDWIYLMLFENLKYQLKKKLPIELFRLKWRFSPFFILPINNRECVSQRVLLNYCAH